MALKQRCPKCSYEFEASDWSQYQGVKVIDTPHPLGASARRSSPASTTQGSWRFFKYFAPILQIFFLICVLGPLLYFWHKSFFSNGGVLYHPFAASDRTDMTILELFLMFADWILYFLVCWPLTVSLPVLLFSRFFSFSGSSSSGLDAIEMMALGEALSSDSWRSVNTVRYQIERRRGRM